MKPRTLFLFLALSLLFSQCNFRKMGRDVSSGLNDNADSIARNIMAGVNKGLSDPAFKANLYQLVDSIVGTAGGSANRTVKVMLDTLLSPRWIAFTSAIIEEATGKKLKGNLSAITDDLLVMRNNLLGPETRNRVQAIVAAAMNAALSDKVRAMVAQLREEMTGLPLRNNMSALRDSLLNEKTNRAIKAIVDTAVLTFAKRFDSDVNPLLKGNLSFIQRNASSLLILLGVIALVIIIVIWRLKQKYAKMTTVMAAQIHAIPDQRAYDDLTMRIKQNATLAGVEPKLREVLQENGLSGNSRQSWEDKKESILQSKN